ncbi:MAG: glycosyltransferase family 39 protein [Thermoproteota archaeon]
MTFRNKVILIFSVALAIRIIFGLGLFFSGQELYSQTGDAPDYLQTAQNFLEKRVWSADPSVNLEPDNLRVPVYPLFLSFFLFLNIPLFFVAIFQDILMAATAVLIYASGRKLFSEKIAFFSAVIFASDPYLSSTFISKAIMTEPIAIFFLVVAFLNLAIFVKEKSVKNLTWGSIFLALLSLTKPQFFFFFIFIGLAILFSQHKQKIKLFAFACGLFFLLVSPWMIYNFLSFRTWQFSSVSNVTIYVIADYFQIWKNKSYGKNYESYIEKAKKIVGADNAAQLFRPDNSKKLAKIGKEIILQNPFSFAFYHITHIPRLFWHDTTIEALGENFGIKQNDVGKTDIDAAKNLLKGNFKRSFLDIKENPIWIISLFLKIFALILGTLAILNPLIKYAITKRFFAISTLFASVIILYAVMISPVGQHRYRSLIEPMILLLSLETLFIFFPFKNRLKTWEENNF